MQPSLSLPGFESGRVSANRANAAHSTGPRTDAGKMQSSRNSLKHGLTSATAVLPSEDAATYQRHCRDFHDEYQPETPTETQLVQELADTAWRLNRIPRLEAELLARSSDYCRRDHWPSASPMPLAPSPLLASTPSVSPASSTKLSISSASSKPTVASASSANRSRPPPSVNQSNPFHLNRIQPKMASFFPHPKSSRANLDSRTKRAGSSPTPT